MGLRAQLLPDRYVPAEAHATGAAASASTFSSVGISAAWFSSHPLDFAAFCCVVDEFIGITLSCETD
ncbi:unnamed protein product [Heligmosomoides polygyrus]|uniref:Uncharacterized protein n=1 Tax=Heligmosomoides polygyrus TaxID=6339 RepID=A0A183FE06_HELPZ|nr:unnamed protein product [Heligmosomoides polygyrus]